MLNRRRSKTEAKLLQPLVTVLRLLLTDGWRELEGHVIQRQGTKSWNFTEKNVIPHLHKIRDLNNNHIFSKVWFCQNCILFWFFHQDDIHLAAGILDTNCFDLKCDKKVRTCNGPKAISQCRHIYLKVGRCIFLSTSMLNNNCEPNCVRKIEDCTIRVFAARFGFYEING